MRISNWSSDVASSELSEQQPPFENFHATHVPAGEARPGARFSVGDEQDGGKTRQSRWRGEGGDLLLGPHLPVPSLKAPLIDRITPCVGDRIGDARRGQ